MTSLSSYDNARFDFLAILAAFKSIYTANQKAFTLMLILDFIQHLVFPAQEQTLLDISFFGASVRWLRASAGSPGWRYCIIASPLRHGIPSVAMPQDVEPHAHCRCAILLPSLTKGHRSQPRLLCSGRQSSRRGDGRRRRYYAGFADRSTLSAILRYFNSDAPVYFYACSPSVFISRLPDASYNYD